MAKTKEKTEDIKSETSDSKEVTGEVIQPEAEKSASVVPANQTGALARPSDTLRGIEGLEGFKAEDVMKVMPYIVLVQGNNPLKETKGYKDGDIVTSNGKVIEQPFEFIVLKTKTVYLEKEIQTDREGRIKKANDLATVNVLDQIDYEQLNPAKKDTIDEYIAHIKPDGGLDRIFIENRIFLGLYNNAPYQMSFKTFMKRKSADKVAAEFLTAGKTLGIRAVSDAVISFSANKTTNASGIGYYTLDGVVTRKVTEAEKSVVASYMGLEIDYREEDLDSVDA